MTNFEAQHYLENKASDELLEILDRLSELSDIDGLPIGDLVMVVAKYFNVSDTNQN